MRPQLWVGHGSPWTGVGGKARSETKATEGWIWDERGTCLGTREAGKCILPFLPWSLFTPFPVPVLSPQPGTPPPSFLPGPPGLIPKVRLQCTFSSKLSTISHPQGSNQRKIREWGILEAFPEEAWPESQFQVRPWLLESGAIFAVRPPPTCGYVDLTLAVKSTYPCT